jgi:hypothetical protein
MAMSNFNKSKFRFSETFNNSDGKTSGSGFVGVIMGLATVLAVLVILAGWWVGKPDYLEMFEKTLSLGLLSAGLMGVRKFAGVISTRMGGAPGGQSGGASGGATGEQQAGSEKE